MSSDNGSATIVELLEGMADEHGERHAVRHLRRSAIEDWSYEQIVDHARRLGAGLADRLDGPLGRGEPAALFAAARPEWIVACLGVMDAGGVATPLDTQLGDDTLERILKDAGVRRVFTDRAQLDRLERISDERSLSITLLDADEEDDEQASRGWRRLLAERADGDGPRAGPDDRAALFYTSGTTGPPKGVPLTHANLASQLAALRGTGLIQHGDPVLVPLPFHHVYPFVIGILAPLSLGATVVLPRARTGPELVRAVRETGVTHIIGVPRFYRAMLEGLESKAENAGAIASRYFRVAERISVFARRRLGVRIVGDILMRPFRHRFGPELRLLASGGSPLDPGLAWKLEGLGWRVAVGYGLTETSPLLTMLPPGEARFDTVGKPVRGVEIRIDPSATPGENNDTEPERDKGKRVGPNEEGEVLAKGPNVFAGYHNLPEATEEAFADGWFRTGDLGFVDKDGFLHLTGRASTLIVTEGGKNVQPDDVEEAYAEHAAIREIGVLQRDNKLVALIVPDRDANDEDARSPAERSAGRAVRKAVEEQSRRLPSYQRIEHFSTTTKSLPRTRLGKLRRHKLEEMYDDAGKESEKSESENASPVAIEDMSEEDRALVRQPASAKVWGWLAERYDDRAVTPDSDPRLDLGIDSMEWLSLTMEIGERTGVLLEEEAIAEIGSVRELLELVAEESEGPGDHTPRPVERPDEALTDEQKAWLEPLRGARWLASRVLRKANRPIVRLLFRLRITGKENIPTDRPVVFAPNHLSHLDPFVIAAALDDRTLDRTHWGAWTGVATRNPINKMFSRLAQSVPIDPDRAVVSSIALGSAVLKRDRNLVWFPEGQRSEDGGLQDFRAGIGVLLDHHRGVAVVPVSIRGTHEALPVGGVVPKPRRVEIAFGEPRTPDQLEERSGADTARERITRSLHARVSQLGAPS